MNDMNARQNAIQNAIHMSMPYTLVRHTYGILVHCVWHSVWHSEGCMAYSCVWHSVLHSPLGSPTIFLNVSLDPLGLVVWFEFCIIK